MKFTSHARMKALDKIGLDLKILNQHNLGPAILHEEFSFFREIMNTDFVTVSSEIIGCSKDFSIFTFEHNFYNSEGENLAYSKIFGVWMDLVQRKITTPCEEVSTRIRSLINWDKTIVMTTENIKNLPKKPQNIEKEILQYD